MTNPNPIQAFVDHMTRQWAQERARSQLTLGKLIDALEGLPADAAVADLGEDHSYRGYYSDLAFEPEVAETTAGELARRLRRDCLGSVYEGYKGGEFRMDHTTPLWVAEYSCCGDRIMGLALEGDVVRFVLQPEDDS